jgi:hypothetical protein
VVQLGGSVKLKKKFSYFLEIELLSFLLVASALTIYAAWFFFAFTQNCNKIFTVMQNFQALPAIGVTIPKTALFLLLHKLFRLLKSKGQNMIKRVTEMKLYCFRVSNCIP